MAASFDSAAKSSKGTESENTNAPDNGNRGHGLGEKVEDALPVVSHCSCSLGERVALMLFCLLLCRMCEDSPLETALTTR